MGLQRLMYMQLSSYRTLDSIPLPYPSKLHFIQYFSFAVIDRLCRSLILSRIQLSLAYSMLNKHSHQLRFVRGIALPCHIINQPFSYPSSDYSCPSAAFSAYVGASKTSP